MYLLQLGLLVAMAGQPAGVWPLNHQGQMAHLVVRLADADPLTRTPPRALGLPNDPCGNLYREGVRQLNNGSPESALNTFNDFYVRCRESKYLPDVFYWAAFARYRIGTRDGNIEQFRQALNTLRLLRDNFPNDFKRGDGRALEQRTLGEMARRGDAGAARVVASQGKRIAQEQEQQTSTSCDTENPNAQVDDVKIAALNALMQMDAAQALPSLQKVLSRRDKGSICLRRAAVLLVAQRQTEGVEAILLNAVRTDPDLEVRKRAVLHLSQYNTDRAFSALDSIVREVRDSELVESAMLALSQSDSPRTQEALRAYAERDDLPKDMQRRVVMLLLERTQDIQSLQKIYKLTGAQDIDIRRSIMERVFGSVNFGDSAAGRWFLSIARDNAEAAKVRVDGLKKGAQLAPITSRIKLYTPKLDHELREQIIAAYSQDRVVQNADAVLDDLAEIAKRDPDSDLRRQAIARISQAKTSHAAEILQDIINQP